MAAGRNFIYTIFFDEDDGSIDSLRTEWYKLIDDHPDVRYYAGQLEVCPQTLRHHIQLYVEYKRPVKPARIATIFGRRQLKYHGEFRHGTAKEASDYCTKEDSRGPGQVPHTGGLLGGSQGHRSDLQAAVEAVQSRKRLSTIASELPREYVKFHKGLHALRAALDQPAHRRLDKRVYVLVGPSRTGKTSWAYENVSEGHLYKVPLQADKALWFDGYEGEEAVLLDDFRGEIGFQQLLRLLDHWPERVPVKGSFVTFQPALVIITSNIEPECWYPSLGPDAQDPLLKRLTRVWRDEIPPPLRLVYHGLDSTDGRVEEMLSLSQ